MCGRPILSHSSLDLMLPGFTGNYEKASPALDPDSIVHLSHFLVSQIVRPTSGHICTRFPGNPGRGSLLSDQDLKVRSRGYAARDMFLLHVVGHILGGLRVFALTL